MTEGIRFNLDFENHSDEEVEKYEQEVDMQRCTEAFRHCGIGKQYFNSNLQDYSRKYEQQKNVIAQAREFFKKVLSGSQTNMIVVGDAGEGKTEFAAGLLKQFAFTKKKVMLNGHELESYFSVKYTTSFELCTAFRKARGYNTKDYGEFSFYRDFTRTYDIMVIDEVGKGGEQNEWALLFDVLDKRMQESKWTVFISNLPYKELNSKLSEYAMSRLNADGNLIIIDTSGLPDFRQNPTLLDNSGII